MDPNRNVTRYSWDIYGNKTAMQYPNREELHYTYNDFGKLETIHEGNDDIVTYQYDARGNVVERKQIQGVTTTYSYDELSRKKESRTEKNGTVISSLSYTFDENGNIATETIDGKMNTYEYDKMDELSRTYKFENDRFLTTDYAYDIYGNQVEKTTDEEANKSFRSYHYDENNKLDRIKTEEGITNIKYTDNGNMSDIYYGDGTKEHYEYDDFDQLTSITKDNGDVYTFEYDPEGERIGYKKENEDPLDAKAWYNRLRDEDSDTKIHEIEEKKEESFEGFKEKLEEADIYKCTFDQESFETDWYQADVKFVLDKTVENSEILNISDEGNQIYGEEGIRLYSQGESANTTYIEGLNNSVYAAVSSTQFQEDKITKYSYDDFGDTENITSGFGYNGERKDDSGLIYLRARYYNPRIGRFIQIDSYKGDLDNAESQNRYIYTINNPYKYIDPSGNISIGKKATKGMKDIVNKAVEKVKEKIEAEKNPPAPEPKGPIQTILDTLNSVVNDTPPPPVKMGETESLKELENNGYNIDGNLSEGNIYNPNSPYYVGDENQPCPPGSKDALNNVIISSSEIEGSLEESIEIFYIPMKIGNFDIFSLRCELYQKVIDQKGSKNVKGLLIEKVREVSFDTVNHNATYQDMIVLFQTVGLGISTDLDSVTITGSLFMGSIFNVNIILSVFLKLAYNFMIQNNSISLVTEYNLGHNAMGVKLTATGAGPAIALGAYLLIQAWPIIIPLMVQGAFGGAYA